MAYIHFCHANSGIYILEHLAIDKRQSVKRCLHLPSTHQALCISSNTERCTNNSNKTLGHAGNVPTWETLSSTEFINYDFSFPWAAGGAQKNTWGGGKSITIQSKFRKLLDHKTSVVWGYFTHRTLNLPLNFKLTSRRELKWKGVEGQTEHCTVLEGSY